MGDDLAAWRLGLEAAGTSRDGPRRLLGLSILNSESTTAGVSSPCASYRCASELSTLQTISSLMRRTRWMGLDATGATPVFLAQTR